MYIIALKAGYLFYMELKVYKYLWDKYHESKINTFAQQGK